MMIEQLGFYFFENVPRDLCATVMSYLDPFSFSKMSQTNNKFYSLSRSDAMQYYFKHLCMQIFKNDEPVLPFVSRFK